MTSTAGSIPTWSASAGRSATAAARHSAGAYTYRPVSWCAWVTTWDAIRLPAPSASKAVWSNTTAIGSGWLTRTPRWRSVSAFAWLLCPLVRSQARSPVEMTRIGRDLQRRRHPALRQLAPEPLAGRQILLRQLRSQVLPDVGDRRGVPGGYLLPGRGVRGQLRDEIPDRRPPLRGQHRQPVPDRGVDLDRGVMHDQRIPPVYQGPRLPGRRVADLVEPLRAGRSHPELRRRPSNPGGCSHASSADFERHDLPEPGRRDVARLARCPG